MGLGLRAAAKQLHISHVALLKAYKNGRVQKLEDGTFDVEECRRSLETNSHPGKQESARSQQRPEKGAPAPAPTSERPGGPDGSEKDADSYHEAVRRREWIKVEEANINLAQKRGELAPVGQVNAWVAGMIMRSRDVLLRIGPELRDRLAQEADPIKCEEMVMEEIHRSLRELAEYGRVAA